MREAEGAVHRLELRHPAGVSRLLVGQGALAQAADELVGWLRGRTVFRLSTPRVLSLHGPLLEPLTRPAARVVTLEVEDGEGAKTLEHAGRLWREMVSAGGKRDSRLVVLGGGSAGDLGGFVAGCFLRGIRFAQVPTTLLAQVDAAIGGKTGVDLPAAKNSVGLFHHPDWVVSDPAVLATLAPEEIRSGLAEVVKMAALLDPPLLSRLEADLPRLLAVDPEALGPVIAAAAAVKIRLVERDPDERDERRLLNFGHTLGHALETARGYRGLRHGEAVAYGMLFALRLAERRGLAPAVAARLRALIARLDLPPLPALEVAQLTAAMDRDKKARESGLVWVLPRALGEGRMVSDVSREELLRELAGFLADPFGGAA